MLITNGKLIPWGSEYQVTPEGLGLDPRWRIQRLHLKMN